MAADRISILMYHQVGDFPPMRAHRSTYCHYKRFAAQMAYLHRFRHSVISLDQAVAGLKGEGPIPSRAVVLTFDDGYENFYEYAFPVLRRYGFPAMVYLISGMLGRDSEWFAADRRATPPLMSAERVRQLRAEGVDFGAHGVSHVKLAEVDRARMADEVTRSKTDLEAVLDEPVRHFCYPYGSHDSEVVEAARSAGYTSAVTCVRAAARPGDDLLALPRKAISYGDNLAGYFWKLHMKNAPKKGG
ncbi:MAG TPA: polysaccharide deacetylase family protein [Gammaproteobacteria bacterium]|nr:polysaccharide deacetylase family protein [Gammaproteobacteria bacterium]